MAIPVPDLTTLDSVERQAALDFTAQRVGEFLPGVETRRGVIGDIVSNLNAALSAAAASVIEEEVFKGSDLSKLIEDPSAFTEDQANRLFGNFRIFRRIGVAATGNITLIFSRRVPVVVPKGAAFTANGLRFVSNAAYAARLTADTVSGSNDRVLHAESGGTYSFSISVTAESPGAQGRLRKDARLTPLDLFPNFVKAYAESDFVTGSDTESNSEMAARFSAGLADKTPSNRLTLEAMILAQSEFQDTKAVSVIGFGDPEQQRYHSVLPIAHGGRVDVYCQTSDRPVVETFLKTSTLVGLQDGYGVWEFGLGVDDRPGAYQVVRIVRYDERSSPQTGYEVVETSPGFSIPSGDDVDIISAAEAAFSPYQTLVVRFVDTETSVHDLTVGQSTADYAVDVEGFPLLKELRSFLTDPSRKSPAGDLLVRAPVPCFVSVSFVISVKPGQSRPDEEAIRSAVVRYVSGRGFSGSLGASALAYVIGGFLTSDHSLGAIDMSGEILTATREKIFIRSSATLTVPDRPDIMTTPQTVIFAINPEDVGISFR